MNRGKKLKQMRRFINKHGVIEIEYNRPPDKTYPPYRKGSYYVRFIPDKDELDILCIGGVNKYQVYKQIVKRIKEHI